MERFNQDLKITYFHQMRINSQLIYVTTLFILLASLMSLPFIYTTVSIKCIGFLRSNLEKVELLAPSNGRLVKLNLKDNQKVILGDVLLTIDASLSQTQTNIVNSQSTLLKMQIGDIKNLIKFMSLPNHELYKTNHYNFLKTSSYQASWLQYQEQLQMAINAKQQAESVFNRYKILYDNKVVTQAEFEQHQFNYKQALGDQQLLTKKYKSQWLNEADQYNNQLLEIKNQNAQLGEQKKQYTLKAAVSGSLQNLTGLQVGTYIFANQKLGEISPDSNLLAHCLVKPSDIGLVKIGQQVRFQIDAFNYNQWGMLKGTVIDISDDIIMQNQTPYFKVKCHLNKNFLQLKNGYKGQVKKGMTLNANFIVAKRSLYQLLLDKVDDWLNPNLTSN